ncbi:MAG: hypothetical protein K8I04_05635 [Gammaproteobacteria bacterium]|nr:hypothetical protein [Gammaproteobacteria bacterium]
MAFVRGATLLDLLAEVPPGAQGFIPDEVQRFIELLNIADLTTRTSGAFFVHEGRVSSATDIGLVLGPGFPIEIPGLTVGVPFQLGWVRAVTGGADTDLEGEPTGWLLDLVLDRVAVVIPIGKPGEVIPASPSSPAFMRPAPSGGSRVKLYARGVLRIEGGVSGTSVRLIADPDPLVPTTPSGTVIETGFSPPHLLLHESGFGLTVDRVVLDLTSSYTPTDITAREHGPDFEGLSVRQATLFLPRNIPFIGDVNLGVRDLLVGWKPTTSFQGEGQLELGVPLSGALTLRFYQEIEGRVVELGGLSGAGRSHTVTVHAETGPTARIIARFPTPSTDASFFRPDHQLALGPDSGWFDVPMAPGGPTLVVFQRQPDADGKMVSTEHTFAFVRSTDTTALLPHIRVRYANTGFSHEFDEVVFLRGPGIALDFVQFSAIQPPAEPGHAWTDEDRDGLRWRWESDGSTRSGTGMTFDLDTGWAQGTHTVTLTDRQEKVRRCRIEVVDVGPLFVGHRTGQVRQVVGTSNVPAAIRAVENSWNLMAFHATDARIAASSPATLSGGVLSVPQGTLAEVTIGENTDPTDPATPPPPTMSPLRHLFIRMNFNDNTPTSWRRIHASEALPFGPPRPYPRYLGTSEQLDSPDDALIGAPPGTGDISAWVASLPGDTRFIVIGRCCDIRISTETRNRDLANERFAKGRDMLIAAGVDAARIQGIGEQGMVPGPDGAAYANATNFAPTGPIRDEIDEAWRILVDYDDATRASWGDTQSRPERIAARGVDIYAILSDPATTPPVPDSGESATRGADLMRALVPGEDPETTAPHDPSMPQPAYRLAVKAAWDSPSIVNDVDWIPTLAQITLEWASTDVQVPGLSGGSTVAPVNPNPGTGPDLWRIIARFTTDQRSGQTSFLLSLDSMGDADGLFAIVKPDAASRVDETVAVTLALAPALLGSITTDDPAGAGVRIAALTAAAAAAAALEIDGEHVIKDGKVIVEKLEGEARLRAIDASDGMKVRLGVDYTASFGVSANLGGAVGVSTSEPIKVRYKNVGLEYEHDTTKPLLERVRFVFEDAQFEVADPGRWSITGALGRLLGITAIRVGAGSIWVEVDIEFALDLGVVKISRTTIRLEIDTDVEPPSISVGIRGIKASIDVPAAVKGGGELMILPDGFGASLELDIIPAKLKAWGSFAYRDPSMVHIEGGVQFATGIPLGNTGLGLFGFAGRFVANGARNLDGLDPVDVYAREVGWHRRSSLTKYKPQSSQFAVGFGAMVGTLPDAAFTFNAKGMLTIGFPDISVVFSIEAVLVKPPVGAAEEDRSSTPAGGGLQLLGIVSIDPTAIGVAISADYEIPRVLKLQVPVGAYFPLQTSTQGGYVRVGSDGGDDRPDRPVTVQLLPDILDLRATAFFMVEERHLRKLGKRDTLNFEGFSIGMGAGLSVKWGGSSIYLKASISVLVGMGTRPFVLAGGLYVSGELRLVIVSLSASGELEALITETGSQLVGKFCGKVDFFFFSIKGCVDFTVGSTPALAPPPADPLVTSLVLADKFTRVVGAGQEALVGLGSAQTAWPDTVPVLRFAHRVRSSIPTTPTGFAPSPTQGWGGVEWSGTNRVRYLYELQAVELVRIEADGSESTLDTHTWPAVWWMPSFRPAVPADGSTPASTHEGWDLALLRWDPAPWSRAHTEGGEGLSSDPADNLGRVCDPAPRPTHYCVLGGTGKRIAPGRVQFTAPPSGHTPYPPDFFVAGMEGVPPSFPVTTLSALAAIFGFGFEPGVSGALPIPFTPAGESVALTHAWRLPRYTRASVTAMSLGIQGTFVPEVSEPELLLAVCLTVPDIGGRETSCLDMAQLKRYERFRGSEIRIGNVRFSAGRGLLGAADKFPVNAPDGNHELTFSDGALQAALPTETDRVSLQLGATEAATIAAYGLDGDGRVVAQETSRGPAGMVHAITLRGAGILSVRIKMNRGVGHLISFCHDIDTFVGEEKIVAQIMSLFQPASLSATVNRKAPPRLPLPIVFGTSQGKPQAWPGEILSVSVKGRHGCAYVRYRPRIAGPWTAFQVMPYPYFHIGVVRICGIRHDAIVAADNDDAARDELRDAWNNATETENPIERYRLLDPGMRYAVQIRYRAAVWVGEESTQTPPSASTLDFDAPPSGVTITDHAPRFHFRTADVGTLPDAELRDFAKQQRFDPRALARYLRGFDPVAEVPSHLRGDPLLVWFEVEWIEDLLDRYGYALQVIVRRTDPPPTPPSGIPVVILPLLEPFVWGGLPFELRNLADQRLISAAVAAPCLEDAPVDGATLQVTAELAPRARYDLVVQAVPSAGGAAIDIGLSHFRASRYTDVTELIEATGFGFTTPNPFYPLDVLVTGAPPSDEQLADDELLDAALTAIGLDPFAPASGPRSVALWLKVDTEVDTQWRLVGLLLDSDEALLRAPRLIDPVSNPPRLDILDASIPGIASPAPSTLVPVRSNESATRVLLACSPGIAVPEQASLQLRITEPAGTRIASRSINSIPLVVLQERT